MDDQNLEKWQNDRDDQSDQNFHAAANAFKTAVISEYLKNINPADLIDQLTTDYTLYNYGEKVVKLLWKLRDEEEALKKASLNYFSRVKDIWLEELNKNI